MKLGIWLLPPIQVVKYWNMGLQTLSNSIILFVIRSTQQNYISILNFISLHSVHVNLYNVQSTRLN